MRRLLLGLSLVSALLLGCTADVAPLPSGGGAGGSDGGAGVGGVDGGGGAGGEPECRVANDCGLTTTCLTWSCDEGSCTVTNTDAPTPCGDGAEGVCDEEANECLCDGEGACVPPSCTDEVKNATETDVDCGGDCAPCDNDDDCLEAADCASGYCDDEGVCSPCGNDDNCVGLPHQSYCADDVCVPTKTDGEDCDGANECQGGYCTDDECCTTGCVCDVPGGCTLQVAIDTVSIDIYQFFDFAMILCPDGADAAATPPRCIIEVHLGGATADLTEPTAMVFDLEATLPLRVEELPVVLEFLGISQTVVATLSGNGACPGEGLALHDTSVALSVETPEPHTTSEVVMACVEGTATDVTTSRSSVADGIRLCGPGIDYFFYAELLEHVSSAIVGHVNQAVVTAVDARACLVPYE